MKETPGEVVDVLFEEQASELPEADPNRATDEGDPLAAHVSAHYAPDQNEQE